jgi:Ca2+-binding RTX toxin-like protein
VEAKALAAVLDISRHSVNRFLLREEYNPRDLFSEVQKNLNLKGGVLSADDTVIEKLDSDVSKTQLIGYYWSGKHKKAIKGINLITLYYTDPEGTSIKRTFFKSSEGIYFRTIIFFRRLGCITRIFCQCETPNGLGGNDSVNGGNGNDSLIGADGNDSLIGGNGNDTISGGVGVDNLKGDEGNDSLSGGDHDILNGNNGDDTLEGNLGNDTLVGGSGTDLILGGSDDDLFIGGFGGDFLYGQIGNDSLYGQSGNDILHGGTGSDILVGGDDNDSLKGGDDNDTLRGDVGRDTLKGDDGTDFLRGDVGDDSLEGGNGNDTLFGGDGADTLAGNNDNDLLIGEEGNDLLLGENGKDTLKGGNGNDTLIGGNRSELLLESGDLSYTITNNQLTGKGTDTFSQIESARLQGGGSNNTLDASAVNDLRVILEGAGGLDILIGGSQNDVIDGGVGNDNLTGGAGNDRFAYNALNDRIDTITDFTSGVDTFSFKASVFGGLAVGVLSADQFVLGSSAGDVDDRFIYNSNTKRLLFDADGNGSGSALLIATLENASSLSNTDITVVA